MSDDTAPRIVLVHSSGFPEERVAALARRIPEAGIVGAPADHDALLAALPGAHALIGCPRPLFDDGVLDAAGDSLQWIHVPGAGCEEFLTPRLVASGITLTNGKIIQGPEVADHALALLLALTRNLHLVLRGAIGYDARPSDAAMPRPIELRGKCAVVIGVGGVGMLIAERLAAFGMRIIGVNPDYVPMLSMFERVVMPEQLLAVLPEADVVCMAAPYAPGTHQLVGASAFATMRPSAYFINVSRGRTVDTDALVQALVSGRIRAAGLDVTDPEPLPDTHVLRTMSNVIVTPHIAGPSDRNRGRSEDLIAVNIERFVRGLPLCNVVDKQLGY